MGAEKTILLDVSVALLTPSRYRFAISLAHPRKLRHLHRRVGVILSLDGYIRRFSMRFDSTPMVAV